MADPPRRWRDIRVVSQWSWRHNDPGTPKPRHGGSITVETRTVNGKQETWVTETLSAQQQISSAVRQTGHVVLSKTGAGAKAAGKLTARTSRRAARIAKAQLHKLEDAGNLDVDDQLSAAGRTVVRTAGRGAKKVTVAAGRKILKKIGIERKPRRFGLTAQIRQAGGSLMVNQVRSGLQLISDGGRLDVDRAVAQKTQRAWQKSLGITGRAARRLTARGARTSTRFVARQSRRTAQWAATKAAAFGVQRGLAAVRVIGALAGAVGAMIPVLALVVGIVAVLCAILPSFITGVGAEHQRRETEHARAAACSGPGVVTAEQVAEFLPSPRGVDATSLLSAQQRETATAIVEEGQRAGIPPRGWAIALMTAMQESTMGANESTKKPNSDGDVGVFQQRAKVGWYADGATMEENTEILNDVRYAAKTFYLGHKVGMVAMSPAGPLGYHIPGLVNIDGWESMDLGKAAQAVQISAFPDYYANHEATVAALLPTLRPQGCSGVGQPGANGLAGVDEYPAWYAKLPDMLKGGRYDPHGFAWFQCTSYAGFAVRTYNSGFKDFYNWWHGAHFGNANLWADAARQVGIRVDQTPTVGSVAQRTSGDYGHVAFVVAVNEDGSFVINEYNRNNTREFSSRTAKVGSGSSDFNNFIHFEE